MRASLRLITTLAVLAIVVGAPRQATGDKPARALVVVVAKDSKVKNLTRAELRRCFTGSTVVISNVRMIPFNFPAGKPERVAFDHAVLGMSPEQVGRYWVDRKIRGETGAPHSLPSALHVSKVVAKFAGAISYLPADQLTDDVVAVAIDGVLPSSTGYPIKLP